MGQGLGLAFKYATAGVDSTHSLILSVVNHRKHLWPPHIHNTSISNKDILDDGGRHAKHISECLNSTKLFLSHFIPLSGNLRIELQ